ncbi:hypothetical protein HDU81_003748 [Chytriomyces hyalinus]|nr:hypothetical protein HDU81_003748 [Chytriomyces hyalinus]
MNKNSSHHQPADMYSMPCPEAPDRVHSSEARRDTFSEVSAVNRTFQSNSFAPESFFIAFKLNKSATCSPLSLPTPVTALTLRDHTAMRHRTGSNASASPLSTSTTPPHDTSSAPLNSTCVHPFHLDQLGEDLEDFHLDAMSSPAWVDSLITAIGNVVPETRPNCLYGEHLLASLCRNGTPLAEVESQDNLTASSSGSPPPFLRIESDIDNGYDSESMTRPQQVQASESIPRSNCVSEIDELDLIETEGRMTSVHKADLDWMRYLSLHSYQSGFRRIPRDLWDLQEREQDLIEVRLESQARNQLRKEDKTVHGISCPTSNKRVEKRRITLDEKITEEKLSRLSCSFESANWGKRKERQSSKRHADGAFPSVETASAPACLISALLQEALTTPVKQKCNWERATCRGVLCNDESTRNKIDPASANVKRHVSFSETVSVVEGSRRLSLPLVHEPIMTEGFGPLSLKAKASSRVQMPKLKSGKNHMGQVQNQTRLQLPPNVDWTLPQSLPEEVGSADSLVNPEDQSCGGILNWVHGLFACFTSPEIPSVETHSAVTITTPLCSIPSMTYGSTATVESTSLFKGLFSDESDEEDFGRSASVRHRRTELQWSDDEDSSDGSESD